MDAREENVSFEILIFWRENRTSRSVEEDLPGTFLKNPISSVICHANGFLNLRYQRDCLNKSRLIQFSSFRRNFEKFRLVQSPRKAVHFISHFSSIVALCYSCSIVMKRGKKVCKALL